MDGTVTETAELQYKSVLGGNFPLYGYDFLISIYTTEKLIIL